MTETTAAVNSMRESSYALHITTHMQWQDLSLATITNTDVTATGTAAMTATGTTATIAEDMTETADVVNINLAIVLV